MATRSRFTVHLAALVLAVAGLFACGDDDPSSAAIAARAAEVAARGDQAFYDTLFGVADRRDEAVQLLQTAVRWQPTDGQSWFHLGMMHLFDFSQTLSSYKRASTAEKAEIRQAREALDQAVPLLPEDRRVPGFRAAALYAEAVVNGDANGIEAGLQALRAAIDLYPEFNNFDFIGTVGSVVAPTDPLFAEVIQLVGNPLSLNAPCRPDNQPEICGNLGKAPHNVEGAMVLFGDLFAKAGNKAKAAGFYRFAYGDFASSGGPWRFRSLIEQRLQTLDSRIAAYRDEDPDNDPPLIGYQSEACAVCHYK